MTIDERIGALTQSVELIASLHRDTGKHLAELEDKLRESAERTERHIIKLTDAMTELVHIVQDQEHRIRDVERPSQ
jgi:hypothetical protein